MKVDFSADRPVEQFPFWEKLTQPQQAQLRAACQTVSFDRNEPVQACTGIFLLLSGQFRVYILSEDGREVTLYRIFPGDICVLSASCILEAVTFDTHIEAVEKTQALLIPIQYFRKLKEENVYVDLFVYEKSSERFSDVMWTMQQILFMRADQRLAIFLWDEIVKTGSDTVSCTHDQIARYIGSAREVVSRTLKYFSEEGCVSLSRGSITVTDRAKLKSHLN